MSDERMPVLVVMGVSGSGKSTVGSALAAQLGVPFVDSDDLHPAANVVKMSAGVPLTDDDRWPWLALVGRQLAGAEATGMVVACSALKRSYRDAIRAEEPAVRFVYLEADHELLETRVQHRPDHFMPASLLDSQLATLEPLAADEPGITVAPDLGSVGLVAALAAA
jgi:gluconokinase